MNFGIKLLQFISLKSYFNLNTIIRMTFYFPRRRRSCTPELLLRCVFSSTYLFGENIAAVLFLSRRCCPFCVSGSLFVSLWCFSVITSVIGKPHSNNQSERIKFRDKCQNKSGIWTPFSGKFFEDLFKILILNTLKFVV